ETVTKEQSLAISADAKITMASVQDSTDPGPTCQKMASFQISSDPAPTCQRMASVHNSTDPGPTRHSMALEHNSLSPGRNCQENDSHRDKTGITSNELDLLFSPMFDDLLNGSSKVVSKSSAVSAADDPNQRQQPTTPLNNHTTPVPTCQNPPITTSVISSKIINQAELHAENAQVTDDDTDPAPTRHSMASVQNSTDPAPTRHSMASVQDSTDLGLLRHLMAVVSMSSTVSASDALNQRQQPSAPLNNHTTPAPTC
nr:hypothetical protein [Tanacetum cinerariifolium]